jgi:hypothetical protein
MQSSLARLMESVLNGGEGFVPSGRGAALRSGEAPGPVHRERGGVRWLSTNDVVENRGEHGDDDLPKVDRS